MTEPADLTSVVDLVARRQQLKAENAAREVDIKELDERIKAAWGDAEEAYVVVAGERQPLGTWKEVTTTRLNQAAAKSQLRGQGILDAFMETSTTRTFRLTWEPSEPWPPPGGTPTPLGSNPRVVDVGPESIVTEPRYSEWDDL